MTNSNKKTDAISILDEVFQLLDESHLKQTIDIPIKMTATEFDAKENEEITFHSFLRIIGAFIKKVYQLKIFCNQQLTDFQAQTKAVAILDAFYRNIKNDGLMAAYLDTRNAELDGFEFIIAQLTAILTQITREKYIEWVFSGKIYSLDWPIKCEIVKIILTQNDRYLPADIKNCPSGILAAQLPDIIQAVLSSELTAKEFLANQLCTFDNQQSVEIETSNHILLLSLLKSFT